jgi:hypothetical protein
MNARIGRHPRTINRIFNQPSLDRTSVRLRVFQLPKANHGAAAMKVNTGIRKLCFDSSQIVRRQMI